ncbi:MAG: peptide deformylase [Verrucomicrobia bacterium]|nr:peptide deformylase [Verrucomicrobiota bacterium]
MSLRYFGDPIFRKRALPVGVVNDEVKATVASILRAMEDYGAIGLAAPHVGVLLRIIVIRLELHLPPQVYLNPRLYDPSKEKEAMEEGSISWPGVRANVERPREISLEAMDLMGTLVTKRLVGLEARVAMHENDQLNGVLFIDRCAPKLRARLFAQLRRLDGSKKSE